MKKKIIFMVINMNIGGTEKALLNMIAEIPHDRYEITILMLEKSGEFLNYIPKDVKVEFLTDFESIKELINNSPQVTIKNFIKQGKFLKAVNIALLHLFYKVSNNRNPYLNYLLKRQPTIEKEYDIAVAYAGPMDFISYFVIHKIKAKKKIQWIHFDISKIGFNYKFASILYSKFDQIFVVSENAKKILAEKLPKLKGRIDTFYNVLPKQQIISLASTSKGFEDNYNGVRILTVGRLSIEKGQDLSIQVLARLKENGYKVRWYCIGEGYARKNYEDLIERYGLEKDYVLLGSYSNPYPFMKECDIYVQSSRHEGYCITLAEAKCFTKPIVTTNFTGAEEQIINGQTGLVVEVSKIDLYEALKQLLESRDLCKKLSINLTKNAVEGNDGLKQIEKLLI
jgi:glycosyltransferase involved in cell wall biosynthesis